MNTQPSGSDVAIIGGGVIGLLSAYRLAQAGFSATLFERGQPGQQASSAALGVLNPKAAEGVPAAYTALEWASLQLFSALADELFDAVGVDVGLHSGGVLHTALDEEQVAALDAAHDLQQQFGIPVKRLSVDRAREMEPALATETRSALRFTAAQNIDNVRLCAALAKAATQAGAHLQTGQPVMGIAREGDRVTGVQLLDRVHACDAIVVAAGSWSGDLTGLRVPVRPIKGQALTVDADLVLRQVLQCGSEYIVPRRDGGLMVGATVADVGFDQRVTVEAVQRLLANVVRGVPALRDAAIRTMWAGLRPAAVDNMPILGPVSACAGLYMATGHFRNGILLSPITAQLLTEWLTGNEPDLDLAPFTPDRFEDLLVS
jgi:glycine oxidase